MNTKLLHNNRGVSNALGFILVFSIVFASIIAVFTLGLGTLDDLREAEQAQNSERAMFVAQQNIDDIHMEGVAGRDTEIQLRDSSLTVGGESEMTVTVDGEEKSSRTTNTFSHGAGDEEVVSEFGALIRESDSGSIMIEDPPMKFKDTTLISTVTLSGDESIGGSTTPLVVFREDGSGIDSNTDVSNTIEIEIETDDERTDAWESYFESEGAENVNVDDETITANFDANTAVIRHTNIDVFFERDTGDV